MAGPRLRRFI